VRTEFQHPLRAAAGATAESPRRTTRNRRNSSAAASYVNHVALARSETIPAPGLLLLGRKLGL
jgi:hypothetical protein